jgi:hypothetical protein
MLALAAWHLAQVPPAKGKDLLQKVFAMRRPPSDGHGTMETLAKEIDWLEHHFDAYGSVVAKQPDVWGQARLTKHRQEFEVVMAKYLTSFSASIQASINRSDLAMFTNSLALGAAVSSPGSNVTASVGPLINPTATPSFVPLGSFAGPIGSSTFGGIAIEPELLLDQQMRFLNHLNQIRRNNEGDDNSAAPGYGLYLLRIPVSLLPGKFTYRGYGAEITLTARPMLNDALLPITFRNLVSNDVVSQLGMPITRIADQNSWNKLGEDAELQEKIDATWKQIVVQQQQLLQWQAQLGEQGERVTLSALIKSSSVAAVDRPSERTQLAAKFVQENHFRHLSQNDITKELGKLANHLDSMRVERKAAGKDKTEGADGDKADDVEKCAWAEKERGKADASKQQAQAQIDAARTGLQNTTSQLQGLRSTLQQQVAAAASSTAAAMAIGPAQRSRQSRFALAPSQVATVLGKDELVCVAKAFFDAYHGPNIRWNDDTGRVLLLDVERWLADEISAAYDLLSSPACEPLWTEFVPQIATQIHSGYYGEVCRLRSSFYNRLDHQAIDLDTSGKNTMCQGPQGCDEYVVKSLAWAILVEASVLNARLIEDMKHTAMAHGGNCMPHAEAQFYLPHPMPDACQLFNEYVHARWPIHVFAVDPFTQEQNVASQFTEVREMQLALSLAFLGGQVSAQDFMQFSRKLQTDIQTIELNGTVVGFSHNNDTFGWRFAPRVQTPPTRSNLHAFAETVVGPCPDRPVLDRAMEPGMRECTALVIMPSFVPMLTVESRSSWVRLNEHSGWIPQRHQREVSTVDMLRLSRSVQSVHMMASEVCDSSQYRPVDIELLMNRVHQLDRQLPMQRMVVQVPIENTIGGFQLFNNGVTDLGPELRGWYGAPGVLVDPSATVSCTICSALTTATSSNPVLENACCTGTGLFLVGNHFSVHDTQVIAGGVALPSSAVVLLSKEVMRVTVPPTVNTVTIEDLTWVDIHVATPYGVTSHLHVPAVYRPKNNDDASADKGSGAGTKGSPAPASPMAMTSLAMRPRIAILPIADPTTGQAVVIPPLGQMFLIPAESSLAGAMAALPGAFTASLPAAVPSPSAAQAPSSPVQVIVKQGADALEKPFAGPRAAKPTHLQKLHKTTQNATQSVGSTLRSLVPVPAL